MLGLLTRSRRPAGPAPRCFRPALERLETRDCPSVLTLNLTYGAGKTVTLSGQVTNGATPPAPVAGVTVQIYGAATGQVPTDANGNYSLTTQASSLDKVFADTLDGQSNTAQVTISTSAPVISNFTAAGTIANYWDFTGHVTDGNFLAKGLIILINGSPVTINNGGQGRTTTVDSNGNFDLCIQLNGTGTDNGSVSAVTTDAWGLQSNTALAVVMQPNT